MSGYDEFSETGKKKGRTAVKIVIGILILAGVILLILWLAGVFSGQPANTVSTTGKVTRMDPTCNGKEALTGNEECIWVSYEIAPEYKDKTEGKTQLEQMTYVPTGKYKEGDSVTVYYSKTLPTWFQLG